MNKPCSWRCDVRWLAAALALLAAAPAWGDSLWRQDARRSMFSDRRAFDVGDILTILVQESNTASKNNNTQTGKSAGVDASISTFLYSPNASSFLTKEGRLPAMKYSSKSDFNGGGSINNSERITARIAVHVVDVLPNQNLVVEGKRRTSFANETQDVVLRGVVRPEDIAANNTIFSYNVAEATIQFVSKGAVTDSQRKGWLTRLWDFVTPF
jgi:flagellar L-ring protein precursor FlgH